MQRASTPSGESKKKQAELAQCPVCLEYVLSTARKCRHCGEPLPPGGAIPVVGKEEEPRSAVPEHTEPPGEMPRETHPPVSPKVSRMDALIKNALSEKYEIVTELGRGGMAIVYRAVQRQLGRTVALKVLMLNYAGDQELVQRFKREAREVARLSHDHIIRVIEEGSVGDVHYFSMEYLEGETLLQMIRRKRCLSTGRTFRILYRIGKAVDYAHANGVIHRDIKSSNIFVTHDGRAVLMDFGIAHMRSSNRLTQPGSILGTPEYMSPEQTRGEKLDPRTDIYSLGVVMYECLTGRVPHKGKTPFETIRRVNENRPLHPKKIKADIPGKVAHIVLRCLEKRPSDRFHSCAEIFRQLQNLPDTGKSHARGTQRVSARTAFLLFFPALLFTGLALILCAIAETGLNGFLLYPAGLVVPPSITLFVMVIKKLKIRHAAVLKLNMIIAVLFIVPFVYFVLAFMTGGTVGSHAYLTENGPPVTFLLVIMQLFISPMACVYLKFLADRRLIPQSGTDPRIRRIHGDGKRENNHHHKLQPEGPEKHEGSTHVFTVRFGSQNGVLFKPDPYGFARKGKILIRPDAIVFDGSKKLGLALRLALFLLLTVIPVLVFRSGAGYFFGLGVIPAYLIVNWIALRHRISVPRENFKLIHRKGRTLAASVRLNGKRKSRHCLFRTGTEDKAIMLEKLLS
ncbi:serine/threonine protein kinase [bacterium]|nr:serine/threonine protein kinase [bacterium]